MSSWSLQALSTLGGLFVLAVIACVALCTGIYIYDRWIQVSHTVRRNYPLIGRFRWLFERMGEFFRPYLFADDREELPFNRAQRAWVYRAAKNIDNTVPFGSTKDLSRPGSLVFLNSAFPVLDADSAKVRPMLIGPHARQPYEAKSLHNISGMSFGAISAPAIRALSLGAAKAGCWMNTGEGGLSPHHLEGGCDIVFQLGTAKYGVRDGSGALDEARLRAVAAHPQVRMFEVKLSQGAKPGKGGILPAAKVTPEIAAIRGIATGQPSLSPNRHPEVTDAGSLLDLVNRVRDITGKPVGIKCVIGTADWLEDLAREIHRRGLACAPDFITIDSGDGGTGAAPMPLMDDVGLPLSESLPLVVDLLIRTGLRGRIRVICSGKLINPTQVAWALCMGADFCTSARGYMFALGCIQALQCNRNTCPAGITTHDPKLQRGLVPADKAERVYHYNQNLVHEVEVIAHACGVREPRELRRHHARMRTADGRWVALDALYPYPGEGMPPPDVRAQA